MVRANIFFKQYSVCRNNRGTGLDAALPQEKLNGMGATGI
jgi:hypothetical protein